MRADLIPAFHNWCNKQGCDRDFSEDSLSCNHCMCEFERRMLDRSKKIEIRTELKVPQEFMQRLLYKEDVLGGVHYVFRFDNGYDLSVIKHKGSYGYGQNLWEACTVYKDLILGEVVGFLTDEEVVEKLRETMELKSD